MRVAPIPVNGAIEHETCVITLAYLRKMRGKYRKHFFDHCFSGLALDDNNES